MGGSREKTLLELMEVLSSSLRLEEVLPSFHKILSRALGADSAALCVSEPELPGGYRWMVEQMPPEFFARYPELAHEDFVRRAVLQRPNQVLRDSEMLPRAQLRRSTFYHHARELNLPLEYVMAVLLDVGSDWHGGLTLYRENRRRPFSKEEQHFLQSLTPALANTVRNCRLLGEAAVKGNLLEALFQHEGLEAIVLVPPGRELLRTAHATTLLGRWFAPMELGRLGLPGQLWELLSQHVASAGTCPFGQDTWWRRGAGRDLKVTLLPLPAREGLRPWALVFQELLQEQGVPVPQEWQQKLTAQELKVVEWMLQGVDNQSLAEQLGLSVNTVKTHLKKIYFKLAVPGRAKLILAAQESHASRGPRGGLLLQ